MIHAEIRPVGPVFEGKAPEIIREELTAAMYEATMFLEREVKRLTPQGVHGAQGGLRSTIHGEVQRGSPVIKGIVGHQSKYGDVIEKGRRPNKAWPPQGSLLRWIEVKLGKSEAEARRLEFVIRRKIGRKGFPGRHMFELAFKRNLTRLDAIFGRYGFRVAAKLDG